MEEPTKNHRKMLSSEILAASPIIVEKCTAQNNEFKTCQDNNQYKHPQVCVQQAENLENCIFSTIKTVKTTCPVEFKNFSYCLNQNSNRYDECRKQQEAFLNCWKQTIN